MSAEQHTEPARAAQVLVAPAAERAATMRSVIAGSSVDAAPAIGGGPDLLVVEQHEQRDRARRRIVRRPVTDSSASSPAQLEQRLSRRGGGHELVVRARRACSGVVSWSIRSQPRTSDGGDVELLGDEARRRRPGVTSPRPHTGLRCCWALSSSPLVVISRSRWMASCGTRNSGRSTSRSRSRAGAVADHHPTESPRSRSSQEFRRAPPYTSTASCR